MNAVIAHRIESHERQHQCYCQVAEGKRLTRREQLHTY